LRKGGSLATLTAKRSKAERKAVHTMDKIPNTPGIYVIRNLINGHIYVGSAISLYRRYHQHFVSLRHNSHKNPHLQAAFNKYSEAAFGFAIFELVDNKADLIAREQHFIDILNPEYNIHRIAGSSLGYKASLEARAKLSNVTALNWQDASHRERMREAARKRFLQQPNRNEKERRAKISAFHKENWKTRDRTVSEEQRAKISKTLTGKPQPWNSKPKSEEHKAKMRDLEVGEATRRKMSEAKKGKSLPFEHAEKIRESNRQRLEAIRQAREQERIAKEQALLARWENAEPSEPIDPSEYKPLTLWDIIDPAS
jgi:group I intron endonuclease